MTDDEFIEGVVYDLRHLRKVLLTLPVEEHTVRLASGILRRLLIDHKDGDLSHAWRQAGFANEPRVSARSLRGFLRKNRGRWISRASAGEARYEAPPAPPVPGTLPAPTGLREIAAVYGAPYPPGDGPTAGGIMDPITLPLKQFLSEACLVVNNVPLSRRRVINYVRDKLAGVHYDKKNRGEAGSLLGALEGMQMNQENGTMRAIYFEVLAIGQSLLASEDVQALCDQFDARNSRRELRPE